MSQQQKLQNNSNKKVSSVLTMFGLGGDPTHPENKARPLITLKKMPIFRKIMNLQGVKI